MDHRLVSAPARPAARAFAIAMATTMLTALIGSGALAQAPPAAHGPRTAAARPLTAPPVAGRGPRQDRRSRIVTLRP